MEERRPERQPPRACVPQFPPRRRAMMANHPEGEAKPEAETYPDARAPAGIGRRTTEGPVRTTAAEDTAAGQVVHALADAARRAVEQDQARVGVGTRAAGGAEPPPTSPIRAVPWRPRPASTPSTARRWRTP